MIKNDQQSNLPVISVISPVLNGEKFIERAIKSVIEQNYPNFEHIVVDGGSSDRTLEILHQYPLIKVISQPGLGQAAALNLGIKIAQGGIITSLNDDDFFELGTFKKVGHFFVNQPEKFVLVGNCNKVDLYGSVIELFKPSVEHSQMIQPWKYTFPINPSSYFYLKKIHQVIGYYNEHIQFDSTFDYEFLLRMSKKYPFFYVNETFGNFRYYPGTKTFRSGDLGMSACINVSQNFYSILDTSFFYYKFLYIKDEYGLPAYQLIRILYEKARKIFRFRSRFKKIINQIKRFLNYFAN